MKPLIETEYSKSYFEELSKKQGFKLCLMGKDPYPSDPIGIPFCKNTWSEMELDTCSGKYVLQSLGYNIDCLKGNYESPIEFFTVLQSIGVAFLNASYHYLGNDLDVKSNQQYLEYSSTLNNPIVARSENLLLCGQAKHFRSYLKCSHAIRIQDVVHPDIRNRINPDKKEEWNLFWEPNRLRNLYNLPTTQVT